jgi:hypothetical protein
MGYQDYYLFMDGCIVKGCKPFVALEPTFGEYAEVLRALYEAEQWGAGTGRWGRGGPSFERWAETHVGTAQSTQNLRTGAARVAAFIESVPGSSGIHLFGTSAAGSAILEYFLLTDPQTLYYHASDRRAERVPGPRYRIDSRITSFTAIDAPTDWVPLRRTHAPGWQTGGRGTLGHYLAERTRIHAGPRVAPAYQTARHEDVPGTWVGATPVAGLLYDNTPHYDERIPANGLPRHIFTGSHISDETHAFLQRAWR